VVWGTLKEHAFPFGSIPFITGFYSAWETNEGISRVGPKTHFGGPPCKTGGLEVQGRLWQGFGPGRKDSHSGLWVKTGEVLIIQIRKAKRLGGWVAFWKEVWGAFPRGEGQGGKPKGTGGLFKANPNWERRVILARFPLLKGGKHPPIYSQKGFLGVIR